MSLHNKVCHLIDANIDTSYFRSIARLHDRKRFPVIIGSIAPAGALQKAMSELETPTFSLRASARWQYPMAITRLAQILKRERVSLIHAHCFDPTLAGLIAARLAQIPFVFTRHHSDHNIRLGKKWHTKIDSMCARNAHHVIAVSEATRQIMIDVERVPDTQITVVYNGMEALREPTVESISQTKRELGIADQHICLVIGRLHEEKGHRFLFDALPDIIERVGPVTVLLAGDGSQRAELESEVRERNLTHSVNFLGRRGDIPELISLASVVVLPSLAESFGFAALEAMSLGKPVVATTTGGLPEVVADGETGMLVPPADSLNLKDAVCRVLQSPASALAMGEAGRVRAAQFTFERMIGGYENVYQNVLERSVKYAYGERLVPSAKE